MAYCVDLETNTRQTKVFTVRHERKARGQIVQLDDPRDVYEMTANQGARRLRACILSIIPGDIVEAAVGQCNRTMAGDTTEPIGDRARKMVAAFGEIGVTRTQLEQRLGHKLESISEAELAGLRKIYRSLVDGMSSSAEWFRPMPPDGSEERELTPDDIKPAGKPEEPQETEGLPPRAELKAEAMKLGIVDKSCSWGAQRLHKAIVEEHDRREAEKAKGVHAAEPPDEPMDVG